MPTNLPERRTAAKQTSIAFLLSLVVVAMIAILASSVILTESGVSYAADGEALIQDSSTM